jgi:hypothetical protein
LDASGGDGNKLGFVTKLILARRLELDVSGGDGRKLGLIPQFILAQGLDIAV